MSDVTVACCQLAPRIGEPEANRAAADEAMASAAASGADVVVLPELAISGYVFADQAEARRLAAPLDGATVAAWSELARKQRPGVVGGVCERAGADGSLFNTSVLIDSAGLRAVYRKAHLWDREGEAFAPGSEPPPV